ncbi:MAG: hypothetical protein KIH69_017915 [Anaerolineae bacterium]|nr:hypothetical protein [Anaerolineae bacterium]
MKTNLKVKCFSAAALTVLMTACGGNSAPAQPTTAPQLPPVTQSTSAPAAATVPTTAPAATKPAAAPAPTATSAPAAPALPVGDPADAVRKANIASTQRAYRSEVVSESKDGKTVIKGIFVPPGNLHATTDAGGAQFEMIIVGDRLWMKRDGKLTESPNAKVMIGKTLEQYAKDPESLGIKISDVKFVGPDVLNGTPTWVYSFVSTLPEANFKSTAKMWIGVANGLPLKQEVEGEFGGIKSKTVQLITYDPNLKVEAPMK